MKIKNSLRALRIRHRNNRVVRRRGRLYVINKTNRRSRRARASFRFAGLIYWL